MKSLLSLLEIFTTSIGKKLLMAVTGLSFIGFLMVHLAGNLSIYGGKETFNAYVHHLHSLGILINLAEIGLLALAVIHILTGSLLFIQNLLARPVRYAVKKNGGGRTWASATMPYTGFFILAFIIFHLQGFHFVEHTNTTVFDIMAGAFSSPLVVGLYIAAVLIVAVHISHGFWSLFQTFGANHSKYMPIIMMLSLVISIVVAAGFSAIPLYVSLV
jgi:succinate dehydrogenase / fumarate reductase, cytochrome b subunit